MRLSIRVTIIPFTLRENAIWGMWKSFELRFGGSWSSMRRGQGLADQFHPPRYSSELHPVSLDRFLGSPVKLPEANGDN